MHDALVAFAQLLPADRRAAIVKVESEGLAERLIELVWPDRSDTRPFDASELHVGMKVGMVDERENVAEPGELQSWETDDDGAVVAITVRWADGSTTTCDPLEGVIRRL
jgi:hypothetical protein